MLNEPEQALRALVGRGAIRSEDAAACLYEAASSGESPLVLAVRKGLVAKEAAAREIQRLRGGEAMPPLHGASTQEVSVPWTTPPPRGGRSTPSPPSAREPAPLAEGLAVSQKSTPATGRITRDAAIPTPTLPPPTPSPAGTQQDGERLPFGLGSSRFAHYELVRRLGEGGMGVVFEARDRKLGRTVALKMLSPDRRPTEQTLRRFEREARAAAKLRHPNICPIYETGEFEQVPYMTMDMIRGTSLAAMIAESGKGLHWRRACEIVRDAARGIAHAHDMGIVHRDVKPSNVLVDEQGKGYVVDFGLAREMDERPDKLTKTGQLVGTPLYMAPERFDRGPLATGPLVDVYALGATLYEAVSGEVPFNAGSVFALVTEIKRGTLRPPRARAGTPGDVGLVCLRALAREPGERYLNAGLMADDLDRVLSGKPVLGRRGGPVEVAREHPVLATLLALALVVLPVALGLALAGSTPSAAKGPPPPPTPPPPPPPPAPLPSGPARTAEEAIERARARIWVGDLLGARASYAEALRMSPSNADAGFEDYMVMTGLLELPGAVSPAQALLVSHPKHPIAVVVRDALKRTLAPGEGTADAAAIAAAIERSPIGPIVRAYHAVFEDDPAKRRADLERSLAERPRCGVLAVLVARDLLLEPNADLAQRALDVLAVERDYEGCSLSMREETRGAAEEALGKPNVAEEHYRKVAAPPTSVVNARGRRASLAIARGDFATAVALHDGREPGSIEDRIALARALLALDRAKEARAVLDLAVQISDEGGDELGILRAAGAPDAEKQAIAEVGALRLVPISEHAAEARARRARLAARMGDPVTAQDDIEKLKELKGASGERRATRGTLALFAGDADAAEKHFSPAFDKDDPVAPDALLDRALALEQLGDISGAIKALRSAIELDRTLEPEAKARLARLEKN